MSLWVVSLEFDKYLLQHLFLQDHDLYYMKVMWWPWMTSTLVIQYVHDVLKYDTLNMSNTATIEDMSTCVLRFNLGCLLKFISPVFKDGMDKMYVIWPLCLEGSKLMSAMFMPLYNWCSHRYAAELSINIYHSLFAVRLNSYVQTENSVCNVPGIIIK